MRDFHGVYVPVPTPFRGDEVAVERLKSNLGKWNETPLSGYAVLVAAWAAIPRDKAFIAGTGTNSAPHTIRQTKRAASAGSRLGTPDGDGIEEIKESPASAGLL